MVQPIEFNLPFAKLSSGFI